MVALVAGWREQEHNLHICMYTYNIYICMYLVIHLVVHSDDVLFHSHLEVVSVLMSPAASFFCGVELRGASGSGCPKAPWPLHRSEEWLLFRLPAVCDGGPGTAEVFVRPGGRPYRGPHPGRKTNVRENDSLVSF